ncbi:MAG: CobW family GTP-binding protein [Chthoniobacterales bacterium]
MTPLVLIVGFLGSGKTTFLRSLLPALTEHGVDPHVVINDYQNAKVDAELLANLAGEITPISGSCVCCGSRDELLSALENFDHQPGRVMVIESNGTTDAEELVELLSLEPDLGGFTLPIQISIIDGKRWQKRFWHNGLERDQIRTANYLHVTRLDVISAERKTEVESSLTDLGVTATRADALEVAQALADLASVVSRLPSRHVHQCSDPGCGHDHSTHSHGHAKHHFASFQLPLPDVVNRSALDAVFAALPPEVIRAKGLARLTSSPEEYHIFQYVDRGTGVQWLPIGRETLIEQPLILFIGPSLPEESLRTLIDSLETTTAS